MKEDDQKRRRLLIVLIAVAIATLLYLIAILIALPNFQNSRATESLAQINSLFPLYYIAIGIMAVACFGCIVYALGSRRLHVSLLGLFGVMLWFTPYYLAGFTMVRDGPWRIGVSMRIPEVFAGNTDAFSTGAATYPISFIYHYSFVNVTGVEPLTYTSLIFPLIAILLFILLGYTLISKMLGDRVAFMGGIDSSDVLNFGSPKDIEEEVKRCIKAAGLGGGYFVGPSHNILNAPWKNILALRAAIEKYRNYPLNL